ncbi:MAG: acyl-CoA dehydrogenase family protein [Sandaracinaceae bacterium]|nr:acyl-CoA dehydrogenase family protein [Sandaracinaceae bacterium]
MGFEPSDGLRETLERIREFVDEELIPLEPRLLNEGFLAVEPELAAKREKVRALGLWAPFLPQKLGGMGMRLMDFAYVSEALGRTPIGHYAFHCQAPDVGNMELLHEHGSPEQQERFLHPLARGEVRSCFAMTEPAHAGSNPVWLGTTARSDGDDYVIDGHKWFTTAADGAAFTIVMAVTDPDAEPHARASQILVPLDAPGFSLVRNVSVMGHPGGGWASHAEVRFDGVRVPKTNRIGPEGGGFMLAQARLGPGRIHHAMRWMGVCDRVFDLMCRRAASREQAPGAVLGTKQLVQAMIAESRAEIDSTRLFVLHTAEQIDRHGPFGAKNEISLIKFHAAGVLQRVIDRALQVHGALGMTDDTPIAFWYREERAARIYDGPDEVHKISVAKRILRDYGVHR